MADLQGYQQLQARLHAVSGTKFGETLMKRLGTAAVREQKILTQPNKKTGVTQASVHVSAVTATSVTTQAGGAAIFLEHGTRGGTVITPKVARVLAWGGPRRLTGRLRSGGKATHFAMRVVRGATRPYPFMVPGAKLAVSRAGLANAVVSAWNSAA